MPVTFTAVVAGDRAAASTTGAVSAAYLFGSATAARRRTFSAIARPVTFTAVVAGQRVAFTRYGALTATYTLGVETAGQRQAPAIYLDYTNGRMYGPKAAGAWPGTPIGILVRDATTYAQLAAGN